MPARELKRSHDHMTKDYGETFAIVRGNDSHEVRGMRDSQKGLISFPSESDVQTGDQLTSIVTRETFTIATVKPHVLNDTIIYVEVRYETADQRLHRLNAEQRQIASISIGSVEGSILNLSSHLSNVTQSIGALPNSSQAEKEALAALMQQLGEALRTVPIDHAEDAETVSERAEAMAKEAKKAKPDQAYLAVSADGLKKAAKNIALVVPAVLDIAIQIADRLQAAGVR